MEKFTGKAAVEPLFPYVHRLFSCRADNVPARVLNLELEESANNELKALAAAPDRGIDHLSLDMQRVIYEKLTMTLIGPNLAPEMALSPEFSRCHSDDERLSLLLSGEVVSMNLRALTQRQPPRGTQ
ncbi:hypothetical protein [Geoalkalibacter halelectricus]|uniref:hypothetical protein n=1 Tax=Geoalkalibacter halelectricus TaxID=2847045 RepID=UPI003D222CD5